jgi:choice-of-anchor B domain-containing protein
MAVDQGRRGASRWLLGALAVAVHLFAGAAWAHDEPNGRAHFKGIPANPTAVMLAFMNDVQAAQTAASDSNLPCVGGFAGPYPCDNIDLLAFAPLAAIGGDHPGSAANDIWGWTDPVTGREYALVGRVFGMSVVDITQPALPVYLGEVFTHNSRGSSWRDIKTYRDHAFIVSAASGHGMQVYDLTQLRNLDPAGAPYDLPPTARYAGFGAAHNVVINEDSGFAYGVGTSTCGGGLHMVNIQNPTAPVDAGCFSADGYTHDAQCVTYAGPDTQHRGKEICFAANTDTLTIVDVTVKASPVQLSRTGYAGRGYTHQGWLSEDHSLYFLDDEGDEQNFGHNTRTRVWNVSDLDAPGAISIFDGMTAAIDHNIYVKGDRLYQANYRAGLSILAGADSGALSEFGYFDIYPSSDSARFNGAWSTYPYFDSGVVVVSGIEQGLFVLLPAGIDFVSIAWPPEGDIVSGIVPIDIKAQDAVDAPGLLIVDWQVNGGAWQSATYNAAAGTFEADWNTAGLGGAFDLTARMTDDGATAVSSRTIIVTVGVGVDDPPQVEIQSPLDTDTVSGNITLSATASDDGAVVGVEFFDNGVKIGDASLSGGLWEKRWNTKKAAEGAHTLTARATDDGGQTAEHGITVTVGGGGGGGGGKPDNGGTKCHPVKDPPDCGT